MTSFLFCGNTFIFTANDFLLLYVIAKNFGLILSFREIVHNAVICFCKSFTSYTSCSIKLLYSFIPNIITPPRLLANAEIVS